MASYPGAFWPGNTRGATMDTADTHTTWHDDVMEEVQAIQAELGLTPSSTYATVASRFTAVGSIITDIETDLGLASGGASTLAERLDWMEFAVCQLYDATQTLVDDLETAIAFAGAGQQLNPLSWHSGTVDNTRVTPTIPGWYTAIGTCRIITSTDQVEVFRVKVARNGTALHPECDERVFTAGAGFSEPVATTPGQWQQMNGTTDYFELLCLQSGPGSVSRAVESRFLVKLVYAL